MEAPSGECLRGKGRHGVLCRLKLCYPCLSALQWFVPCKALYKCSDLPYRAYIELVCYVPWKDSPDDSFLDTQQRAVLEDAAQDAEKNHRYSLQQLEMFWQVHVHVEKLRHLDRNGTGTTNTRTPCT